MRKKSDLENALPSLRQKAEHLFLEKTHLHKKENSLQMIQEVLQELCIHQIELEMQNEELHESKEELHRVKESYFDLYERAPIGYCTLSEEGKILQVNLTMATLLILPKSKLLDQPIETYICHENQDTWYLFLQKLLKTRQAESCELRMRQGDGTLFWSHLDASLQHSTQGIATVHLALNDINLQKEAQIEFEATIHALAYYDALTKLPNRRLVQDRLVQAIGAAERSDMYGALLFIDVDHFKLLNDTKGHDVGDTLLVEIAKRLKSTMRSGDTLGRQGGDEFMLLLSHLSVKSTEAAAMALQFGRKIYELFEKPFDLNGFEYPCKISTGVSLFQKGSSAKELFKHADIALYQAKDAGRNTLRFFDPKMQEAINLRTTLEFELHSAIALHEFCLYYQPQIDETGHCVGVEALMRWNHPKHGFLSPASFIPLAEDTGLILPMGLWVLESACAKLKQWEKDPCRKKLHVAINVSLRQFRQPSYVAEVEAVLHKSRINPALLKLELTESLLLEDIVGSIAKMYALKKLGVTFSMDDFGTGYSSLSYLAKLPLDQLKIDKSFIDNIPGEENNEIIVRTIIAMGEGMAINVIAEGVETQAQKEFLHTKRCRLFQGYLFSHPLPEDELEAFLDKV
jgi:diguanylate cyclase (GGDEF)-like protein/PAS domain S-box-containing protein